MRDCPESNMRHRNTKHYYRTRSRGWRLNHATWRGLAPDPPVRTGQGGEKHGKRASRASRWHAPVHFGCKVRNWAVVKSVIHKTTKMETRKHKPPSWDFINHRVNRQIYIYVAKAKGRRRTLKNRFWLRAAVCEQGERTGYSVLTSERGQQVCIWRSKILTR